MKAMSISVPQIPDGHKFSALILENMRSVSITNATRLDNETIYFHAFPFLPNTFWLKEFGERFEKKFRNGKFFLLHHLPSASVEDADEENQILANRASFFLIALWLTRSLIYDSASVLTGYKLAGDFHIKTVPSLGVHYLPSAGITSQRIDINELQQAHAIWQTLQNIDGAGTRWERLRGGIRAFLHGLISFSTADERTHQFVRALDAIVMTRQGRGEADFTARCAYFLVSNPGNEDSLRKMYRLRNASEHFREWMAIVSNGGIAEADRLTRQVEELARSVLRGIMIDSEFLNNFVDETSIAGFWSAVEAASVRTWANSLDLTLQR